MIHKEDEEGEADNDGIAVDRKNYDSVTNPT